MELWEQANCLEVLLETLLGCCIENNKTFMSCIFSKQFTKLDKVEVHTCTCALFGCLSAYLTKQRLCCPWSLLTTGDKTPPALRNLQPRWTLQEDRKIQQ